MRARILYRIREVETGMRSTGRQRALRLVALVLLGLIAEAKSLPLRRIIGQQIGDFVHILVMLFFF